MNDPKYEIVKFKDNEFELDVSVSPVEETVWLNQEEIALLFNVNIPAINKHIKNIINDEELEKLSTISKKEIIRIEGNRSVKRLVNYYNLDMIISIGYRVNSKRGILFRKWATLVLKKFLIKGFIINESRTLVANENYAKLIDKVGKTDERLVKLESSANQQKLSTQSIFFNGEVYDAYSFIQQMFEKAENEIIIIDNYTDRTILDRLKVKNQGVKVFIYTSPITSKITKQDETLFNKQYGSLIISQKTNIHDRFIIIDGQTLFHVGASIKDAEKNYLQLVNWIIP